MDFLIEAFGFHPESVDTDDEGHLRHAELSWRGGLVMLSPAKAEATDAQRSEVYVVVEDPDSHHDRAVAAGAGIVDPLHDTSYGSRDYSARDPEGTIWYFGTYVPQIGD